MAFEVLCLRPEADFARVDALPPASLQVTYGKPDDPALPQRMKAAAALVIPAVGAEACGRPVRGLQSPLVQITGAGVDRLDEAAMTRLGIPVANVPGASNSAVAEYAVTVGLDAAAPPRLGDRPRSARAGTWIFAPHAGRQPRRDWRACWWAWSGSARSEPRSRRPSSAWAAASLSTIRRPATSHAAQALGARSMSLAGAAGHRRRGDAARAADPGDARHDR